MTIVEIGADFFESALFVVFLDLFNGRRLRGRKALAGGFVCFALLLGNILASDMMTIYSYVPMIFDFAITMCYARLCLEGTIWRQLGSVMLYEMGLLGSSVIVIWLLAFARDNGILLWMDTMSSERMWMVALSKILLLLYALFLLRWRGRFRIRRSRETMLTVFLVPAIVLALAASLLGLLFEVYYMDGRGRIAAGIMGGIMALFAVSLYLYSRVLQKERLEQEREYAVAMAAQQKREYEDLLRHQESTRMMEHDMRNRLLGIRSYFVSGETARGIEKIDDLLGDCSGPASGLAGGGCPWRAVIEDKLAHAREQGISVESRIGKGGYDAVDDIDFCIILGNLLDNAVEAQESVEGGWIGLHMSEDKGVIYIRLENRVADGGSVRLWETSKDDRMRHGFGIRSVKEILKRYGGTLEFEVGDGKVIATVLLKMPS